MEVYITIPIFTVNDLERKIGETANVVVRSHGGHHGTITKALVTLRIDGVPGMDSATYISIPALELRTAIDRCVDF